MIDFNLWVSSTTSDSSLDSAAVILLVLMTNHYFDSPTFEGEICVLPVVMSGQARNPYWFGNYPAVNFIYLRIPS
jgi:hypothetical protein